MVSFSDNGSFIEDLKPCIEDKVKGKFVPPNLRKNIPPRNIEIYKQILENARLSKDHIENIQNLSASDGFVCGSASQKIYGSIILSRTFDPYGRIIKAEIPKNRAEPIPQNTHLENWLQTPYSCTSWPCTTSEKNSEFGR